MATLVRWEPFREIAALQNEMSRFMNGLLEGNGRTTQSWVPALDVWETESAIVFALTMSLLGAAIALASRAIAVSAR